MKKRLFWTQSGDSLAGDLCGGMERVQSLDFPDGTYFFEQTTYRKRPRRQRKRPEDLPKVDLFDLIIDTPVSWQNDAVQTNCIMNYY